ncbi:sodium-dependent multivitamin transporter-like [Haliotis rufescens]|uniref:sodium-dependent multivitamin transporter-like n=1 Tax=Haliotis rufescens TaxID=6454 RepID=UPI00201F6EC2|nr:sodium-dependent multivitamin transporter-like [Haliotis rufescens]
MAKVSVSEADYVVICGFLSLSVGIGLYYAVRGRRRNTREEYLMGGRRLHVIPVTLSLCVTYLSSTSFVGMPAETFSSGFTYAFVSLGCAVAMFITVFTVVPMMHSLQLTSVYEYFQLRFGSVVLRRCISVVGMMQNGVHDIGGIGLTWDLAVQGGRVPPVDFSADPRVRHSFWSLVVGGAFMFMAYIFDQSAIQRMCALPSVRQAKLVYAATGVVVSIYVVSISFLGVVAYSYYTVQGCDPFKAGYLKNRNQLVPYFMMEIFNGFPGMTGLFLATIFSAGLSSVSSVINGLAANTIEDLLRPVFDRYNTTEKGKIFTAKMSVESWGTKFKLVGIGLQATLIH